MLNIIRTTYFKFTVLFWYNNGLKKWFKPVAKCANAPMMQKKIII